MSKGAPIRGDYKCTLVMFSFYGTQLRVWQGDCFQMLREATYKQLILIQSRICESIVGIYTFGFLYAKGEIHCD